MDEEDDIPSGDNHCPYCGSELYNGRCLDCEPTEYEKNHLLPEDYCPGDPFW